MDQYARDHGHDPTGSWILIVHEDGTSDFFSGANATEAWCCSLAPLIRAALAAERPRRLDERQMAT